MRERFLAKLTNEEVAITALLTPLLERLHWGTAKLKIRIQQTEYEHGAVARFGRSFLFRLGFHVKTDSYKTHVGITDVCFVIDWDRTRNGALLGYVGMTTMKDDLRPRFVNT